MMKRSRFKKTIPLRKAYLKEIKWLIILIFPIGWWVTIQLFPTSSVFKDQITDLTVISFIASFIILFRLKLDLAKEAHLWSIYLVFLIGHYVKFYLMQYWKLIGSRDLKNVFVSSTISLLSSPEVVIETYKVLTVSLCALSLAIYLATRRKKSLIIRDYLKQYFIQSSIHSPYKKWIILYIICWIIITTFLLFLQADLRLGARIGPNFSTPNLPFKLSGIIHYSNTLLAPAVFAFLIFIADEFNNKVALRIGVIAYFFHAVIATVITTSKGPLPMAMLTLATIWGLSGRLNPGRRNLFLAALPFLSFIFSVVSSLRELREVGEVGSLAKLPDAIAALSDPKNDISSSSKFVLITRIQGIDTLLEIVYYCVSQNITFDFDRIYSILFNSQTDLNAYFATHVLGITNLTGLGVSAGLTGSFYLLFCSSYIVGLAIFLYAMLWHILFQLFSNMPLVIKPIALAQICVLAAATTSEGSLDAAPYQILVVVGIIFIEEALARFLLNASLTTKSQKHYSLKD